MRRRNTGALPVVHCADAHLFGHGEHQCGNEQPARLVLHCCDLGPPQRAPLGPPLDPMPGVSTICSAISRMDSERLQPGHIREEEVRREQLEYHWIVPWQHSNS